MHTLPRTARTCPGGGVRKLRGGTWAGGGRHQSWDSARPRMQQSHKRGGIGEFSFFCPFVILRSQCPKPSPLPSLPAVVFPGSTGQTRTGPRGARPPRGARERLWLPGREPWGLPPPQPPPRSSTHGQGCSRPPAPLCCDRGKPGAGDRREMFLPPQEQFVGWFASERAFAKASGRKIKPAHQESANLANCFENTNFHLVHTDGLDRKSHPERVSVLSLASTGGGRLISAMALLSVGAKAAPRLLSFGLSAPSVASPRSPTPPGSD